MRLSAGQRLGPYELLSPLGAGGMGEVYRARDTKLGRDVAIKVLTVEVAQDPERLARFGREAHLLAALNHPNIAAIHGLEEEGAQPFLVLELVEGEDLAVRLKRGPIPVDEALEIAKQIAEALEDAHAKGIVHRDLKPANVKLTSDGKVKVLDFGLAKAYAGDTGTGASSADLSQSPTLARSGTLAGVILGTAAYMPPEQASGKTVDKRADIWAFGVVLFEMLTGRALFTGETVSEILASVIKEEPSWERLPADCPPAIAKLLRRCLRKRPRERLQDIGDARLELSDVLAGVPEDLESATPGTAVPRAAERRRIRERWAWAAVALVSSGLAALLALLHFAQVPAVRPAAHFVIEMPDGVSFSGFDPLAISPDGRFLAFTARPPNGNQSLLWIRPLESPAARPVPGTEGAESPFWSPDSGSVAFFAGPELKRIILSGGAAQKVCPLPLTGIAGGTWSPSGTIVFASGGSSASRLFAVAANGGEAKPLTTLDQSRGETGHTMPWFLPDGRRFLFMVGSPRPESGGLHAASLDSPGERRRILAQGGRFEYAPPGRLLFVRENTLLAQSFDWKRLEAKGEAVPVAQSVDSFAYVPSWGWFSASAGGVLAYMARGESNHQLAWLDRKGGRLGNVGKPAAYGQIVLSPDERRVAVEIPDAEGNNDIWLIELARAVASRLTFDPASEMDPVWSPDGRELVFARDRNGRRDIVRKSLSANETESLLLESPVDVYVKSWSGDGRFLVYVTNDAGKEATWALPLKGGGKPEPLLNTGFRIDQPQVSPDGRWLAYISEESGRWEVYVQPFRRAGEKLRVSPEGGGQPKWRGDGKELFYLSTDGRLMAVDVRPGEARIEVGLPTALFEAGRFAPDYYDYAVTADGQRFLMKVPVEKDAGRRIHVIINWPSLVR